MLIKLGESQIRSGDIQSIEKISNDIDLDIENRMTKFAKQLKVIAPQAKDFLYFTCVMMHAAEASLLNDDGSLKKHADGSPVRAQWEKVGDHGIKWICSDRNVKPYKNNNNDIFPEKELKVAYKKWVGRPLCLDHQSQSVDKIRGVIVDTVWDEKRKRVIALCALDKKNYPDLAHKVASGVATNVSMGTAVGRAVCTEDGCHRVAKTERDFCQHMRNKSCYGEINLDLSPIELSLVVSGADPKAKVKHIIAKDLGKAAETLTDYLGMKEGDGDITKDDLKEVQKDLEQLTKKISKLTGELDEITEETDIHDASAYPATRSTYEVSDVETSGVNLRAPEQIPLYASDLQKAIMGAQEKIAQLQENYNRLSSLLKSEESMTRKNAYFQGTVEPKPGETMYTPDPLADKARLMDKHLHGPGDFPDVGNVEGMYPGITQDDEELKKKLQRLAEEEERALFREAALKKAKENLLKRQAELKSEAYWQGTTEPKPGQTTYKPDPLNNEAREDDKHLQGQKPFPDVGNVDGLYGDDMKTKEKLSRASLNAKFRKAAGSDGRLDKAASRWEVYANDTLILTASVDQITKGNADVLFESVATKRFGKSLLDRIQSEGFEATRAALLKTAGAPPAPPAMPEMPPAAPPAGAPPAPPVGAEEPPQAPEKGGDRVKEIINDLRDLLDEIDNKISDLEEHCLGPVEEDATHVENVEPAPEHDFAGEAPKTASQLQRMRKTVNGMLRDGIHEMMSDLSAHAKEIKTASELYKRSYDTMTPEQRKYLNALAADAVTDAKSALRESVRLMGAVVKYAHGTAELEKRAMKSEKEEEDCNAAEDPMGDPMGELTELTPETLGEIGGEEEIPGPEETEEAGVPTDVTESIEQALEEEAGDLPEEEEEELEEEDVGNAPGDIVNQNGKTTVELNPQNMKFPGPVQASLNTKESRAQARMKLAEKAVELGFNDLSGKAHPKGSVDAPNVETKPSVDAKFHVPQDLKSLMLDLANLPPKVRKQAEEIHNLVTAGQLDPTDVDGLVAHGVDPAAVKYWKEMWGAAGDSESKEFATKMVAEHQAFKAAEDMTSHKARIKQAYELAYDMERKGMIDHGQIDDQVNEIMNWNEAGFNSVKNMIGRKPVVKQASIPNVGLLHSGDVILPSAQFAGVESVSSNGSEIKNYFESYFANKRL